MSQLPFDSSDYEDGEIHRLIPGSPLWVALTTEPWLNCSPTTREYYIDRLHASHRFSGTVLSKSRQQVELTYIPHGDPPMTSGPMELISISLANMRDVYFRVKTPKSRSLPYNHYIDRIFMH